MDCSIPSMHGQVFHSDRYARVTSWRFKKKIFLREITILHLKNNIIPGEANSIITNIHIFLNFANSLWYNFTHFHTDQFPQRFDFFPESLANLTNNFTSLRCGNSSPDFPCLLLKNSDVIRWKNSKGKFFFVKSNFVGMYKFREIQSRYINAMKIVLKIFYWVLTLLTWFSKKNSVKLIHFIWRVTLAR